MFPVKKLHCILLFQSLSIKSQIIILCAYRVWLSRRLESWEIWSSIHQHGEACKMPRGINTKMMLGVLYIYIYHSTGTYIDIHTYAYIYTHIYTYTCICIQEHIYIYVYMYVCITAQAFQVTTPL